MFISKEFLFLFILILIIFPLSFFVPKFFTNNKYSLKIRRLTLLIGSIIIGFALISDLIISYSQRKFYIVLFLFILMLSFLYKNRKLFKKNI